MDVPFISFAALKESASNVFDKSDYGSSFPVNIEMIVEQEFGIEIVPIPGLQKSYQIDAFITSDLRSIWVDEYVMESREKRYRFTLAHEIGHLCLHEDIFKEVTFDSAADWKEFITTFPKEQYGFLEYQANTFAGCLLIPDVELEPRFEAAVAKIRNAGIEIEDHRDEVISAIATELGEQFNVSTQAMSIRLSKELEYSSSVVSSIFHGEN